MFSATAGPGVVTLVVDADKAHLLALAWQDTVVGCDDQAGRLREVVDLMNAAATARTQGGVVPDVQWVSTRIPSPGQLRLVEATS